MKRRTLLLLPLCPLGCSTPEHLAIAEAEVPKFHQAWNEGRSEQVWYQATTQFQNKYTKEEFLALVAKVKAVIGNVKSTSLTGFKAEYQGTSVFATLVQQTTFERAEAAETFTYRVDGASAFLTLYFIQSPALGRNDA
jgi:hypothetical protein